VCLHQGRSVRAATHTSHRALLDDIICGVGVATSSDRAVITKSEALRDKHLLYGITGGIASVDAVRVARELRRHGAQLTVCMTQAAQKIISPLALEWASSSPIIDDWSANMNQLDVFDGVVVAPSTRNFMARCALGILDEPLLMAIAKSFSTDTPVIMFPSMHEDLANDSQTSEIITKLTHKGVAVHWGPLDEDKHKQLGAEMIGMMTANAINARIGERHSIAITLGGTESKIDPVRSITNRSSGQTGYTLATKVFLRGHEVTTIEGRTVNSPNHTLWKRIKAESAKEMSEAVLAVASTPEPPNIWIWAAAILDYVPVSESPIKISSEQEKMDVTLRRAPKIIEIIQSHLSEGVRQIGFKLTAGVSTEVLLAAAESLREAHALSAVVGNRLEEMEEGVRAHWVDAKGVKAIATLEELADNVCEFIEEA